MTEYEPPSSISAITIESESEENSLSNDSEAQLSDPSQLGTSNVRMLYIIH